MRSAPRAPSKRRSPRSRWSGSGFRPRSTSTRRIPDATWTTSRRSDATSTSSTRSATASASAGSTPPSCSRGTTGSDAFQPAPLTLTRGSRGPRVLTSSPRLHARRLASLHSRIHRHLRPRVRRRRVDHVDAAVAHRESPPRRRGGARADPRDHGDGDDADLGASESRRDARLPRGAPHRADDGDAVHRRAAARRARRGVRAQGDLPDRGRHGDAAWRAGARARRHLHEGRLRRSDRHLLRRVRHRRRSARAESRRLRDRTDGGGGHPRDRAAHWRVDESGAVARARRGEWTVRGAGRVLDRADPRRGRRGAAVRHALPAPREGEPASRSRGAERLMPYESPVASDRSTALRRGVLFIVATSPIWLVPKSIPVFHPVAMLGILIGATLLFLWWDKRSPSELGLELSWRPLANLLGGLVGGTLMILVIAVLLHAILPFEWTWNTTFLWRLVATGLVFQLLLAGVEELLFRGYSFERLISSIGLWPAQLIVALLFAVYHLRNGYPWQVAFTGSVI